MCSAETREEQKIRQKSESNFHIEDKQKSVNHEIVRSAKYPHSIACKIWIWTAIIRAGK
jgi:hypothetical protein